MGEADEAWERVKLEIKKEEENRYSIRVVDEEAPLLFQWIDWVEIVLEPEIPAIFLVTPREEIPRAFEEEEVRAVKTFLDFLVNCVGKK